MTLHTYDINPQDDPIKVATVKKKPAKKKPGAKAKRKVVKKTPKKPEPELVITTDPIDPIEHSLMNPIPQPKRERGPGGELIRVIYEPIEEKLTVRQERFCQLYTEDGYFFGNGVQAYLEIYDIDTTKTGWYKTACVNASRLLSNAKVTTRINSLLSDAGLNKEFMDKQLLFLATQHDDKTNKLGAIKEFNRITKRVDDNPGTTIKVYVADEAKIQKFRAMKKKAINPA